VSSGVTNGAARAGSSATMLRLFSSRHRGFHDHADVVFAVRMLRKAPGFTAAAVLATALGIGANTAIFTVVKQVLLRPLPYPDAGRIVDVSEYKAGRLTSVSPPNFMDWRAKNQTLAALSAYSENVLTLSTGTEPSRVSAGLIDPFMVDAMRVHPLFGRSFTADDMRPGARKVVILGFGVWQRVFGGDRTIVSHQITLEGEPHEIVGVMPRGYSSLTPASSGRRCASTTTI
jgi:hypothetical protein